MAKRGINPHVWFYGFARDLAARGEHVRRALHGNAAEQWVNAELCAYLARQLPKNRYAFAEYKKRDVSVFNFGDGDAPGTITEAVIETKLIYGTYREAKVKSYTQKLCAQMQRAREKVTDENGGAAPLAIGLLLGVWASWPEPFAQRLIYTDLGAFRRKAGACARAAAETMGAKAAKEALETIVPLGAVSNGGVTKIDVAIVGQYLLLDK